MKLTIVGDPHVTHANLDKIDKLFNLIENQGNDCIILGDLFDTKEIVRGKCLNVVIKNLKRSKLHFYILVGNHDWFNLDCQEHALETLKELHNVTIVDRPLNINFDSRSALLVPFYSNLAKLKTCLTEAVEGGTDFLFMHQGVIGFDYGNGYVADGRGHGEMAAGSFKGFERVISGHFHKYAEDENLTFLGTPFSHSHGESDQRKFIAVLDTLPNTLELLETPFPRHRTIRFVCSPKSTNEMLAAQLVTKDIFRVILMGTELDIKLIDQSRFPGVKFIEEPNDIEQAEGVSFSDTDSNEQKFINWATEIKALDEDTVAMGLKLLEEVA